MPDPELRKLLDQYIKVLRALRPYRIASVADIAEYLFEQALGGKREPPGKKGHDIIVYNMGRVQVKARCLPDDGRREERLHLGNMTCNSCEFVGAVIFTPDLHVSKAILAPAGKVWELVERHADPQKKVRFDLLVALPGTVDMTKQLQGLLDDPAG